MTQDTPSPFRRADNLSMLLHLLIFASVDEKLHRRPWEQPIQSSKHSFLAIVDRFVYRIEEEYLAYERGSLRATVRAIRTYSEVIQSHSHTAYDPHRF